MSDAPWRSTPMRRTLQIGGRVLRGTVAGILAVRMARTARRDPPLAPTDGRHGDDDRVSVVIPARDEERRLGACLAAVVGAPGVHEVIVVDDHSRDATAEVARRGGARVVAARDLPTGWAGKTWALQQGIDAATGGWVVTLDADTRPDPGLVAALVDRARTDRVDLATVAGAFECPGVGAAWLHPAMLTTLVYRFGAPPGVLRDRRRALANGQCMVLPREEFLAAGGFAPVAHHMVEDVALARRIMDAGGRVALYDGSAMLRVRMYEDLVSTWTGWGRSLALGRAVARREAIGDAAVVAVAMLLAPWRLIRGRGDRIDLVSIMLRLGTLVGTAASYRPRSVAYWVSPMADPLAVAALVGGIIAPDRRWRGRRAPSGPPARTADRSVT